MVLPHEPMTKTHRILPIGFNLFLGGFRADQSLVGQEGNHVGQGTAWRFREDYRGGRVVRGLAEYDLRTSDIDSDAEHF